MAPLRITRDTVSALLLAMAVLAGTFAASSATFVYVLYGGTLTKESAVEASNYAMQTVTTVGYGNWETPALKTTTFDPTAVLWMRLWSVLYMFLGGTAFAVFTAVVVSIFIPPA